jgi:PilZ domain
LAVPVRVTVVRSGTAYSIPGRSLNLGEGGISVVLAGEVHPADPVGIEFLLPDMGLGLQAKAVVRHHSPMGCGFEFQGLTRHQQAVIREWSRQMLHITTPAPPALTSREPGQETPRAPAPSRQPQPARRRGISRLIWPTIALFALAVLLTWWHWQREWKELEDRIPRTTGALLRAPASPWITS